MINVTVERDVGLPQLFCHYNYVMLEFSIDESSCVTAETTHPVVVTTSRGCIEYASMGDGPAVLTLHGAMGGYDQGLILARTIGPATYRFVAASRPGYLRTPLASGPSAQGQADLCLALLDALGIENTAVMAISGGGPCALHLALRNPDRCRALVLISSCSQPINGPVPLAFRVVKFLGRWNSFASAIRRSRLSNIDKAASRSISDPVVRARTLQDPVAGPMFVELMKSTFDNMALRLPGTENDIRISRTEKIELDRLAVPTLIVHGTEDRVVPFEQHARSFESRIPGAQLLAIEGGEHACVFTHRNEIKDCVSAFLNANFSHGSKKIQNGNYC